MKAKLASIFTAVLLAFSLGAGMARAEQTTAAQGYQSYLNALKRAKSFADVDPYITETIRVRRNQELQKNIPPEYDTSEGRQMVETSILRIMSTWASRQSIFSMMPAHNSQDASGKPVVTLAVSVRDLQTQQQNIIYPMMVYEQDRWKYAGDRPAK